MGRESVRPSVCERIGRRVFDQSDAELFEDANIYPATSHVGYTLRKKRMKKSFSAGIPMCPVRPHPRVRRRLGLRV